ncbi:hypothetical protein HK098_006143 [Nowakowskiella sp. JEL0407]|nr:hypothetical protein HK098_006143 [Nowakowskiella sp. JEL0407]
MPHSENKLGFGSLSVHAGQIPDPQTGAVIPPIYLSTTFAQSAAGVHQGYEYSRSGNPTRDNFELAVAKLENAKYGLAFASGSVTTATISNLVSSGGHIVSVNDVYGGTFRYFTKVAKNNGVSATFVDLFDPISITNAIRPNTKLVWIETPTNPTLRLVDIETVAKLAHTANPEIIVVVDNTFMSPYFQKPLNLGADIVVHSVTKYINGHSDAIMGIALLNSEKIYNDLKFLQNAIGGVPSAFDCYLAHRGLKTLHLRMRQHEKNAMAVARFLESSPYVTSTIYPGIESHPQHELAKKQQSGFGGMVSFRIKGGLNESNLFLRSVRIFVLAESLGGVESLAELPAVMTHASLTPEARKELGVDESLIRLSCGIEDTEDLVQDVKQALEIVGKSKI